jgi:hypothetical protein
MRAGTQNCGTWLAHDRLARRRVHGSLRLTTRSLPPNGLEASMRETLHSGRPRMARDRHVPSAPTTRHALTAGVNVLPGHGQGEHVKAADSREIGCSEGSARQVEISQKGSVRNAIRKDLDAHSRPLTTQSTHPHLRKAANAGASVLRPSPDPETIELMNLRLSSRYFALFAIAAVVAGCGATHDRVDHNAGSVTDGGTGQPATGSTIAGIQPSADPATAAATAAAATSQDAQGSQCDLPDGFPTDVPVPDGTCDGGIGGPAGYSVTFQTTYDNGFAFIDKFSGWVQETKTVLTYSTFYKFSNDLHSVTITVEPHGENATVYYMVYPK